jgi:hypothetical protein
VLREVTVLNESTGVGESVFTKSRRSSGSDSSMASCGIGAMVTSSLSSNNAPSLSASSSDPLLRRRRVAGSAGVTRSHDRRRQLDFVGSHGVSGVTLTTSPPPRVTVEPPHDAVGPPPSLLLSTAGPPSPMTSSRPTTPVAEMMSPSPSRVSLVESRRRMVSQCRATVTSLAVPVSQNIVIANGLPFSRVRGVATSPVVGRGGPAYGAFNARSATPPDMWGLGDGVGVLTSPSPILQRRPVILSPSPSSPALPVRAVKAHRVGSASSLRSLRQGPSQMFSV